MRLSKIIASTALAIVLIQPGMAVDTDDSNDPIINKFLDASRRQQQALLGSQMEVDIDAKLPKLKEQGKMKFLRTVRTVPKLGQIFYRKLGEFVGDKTVQSQVIERYVELSKKTGRRSKGSFAITPANYKFHLKAKITMGDQLTYVFDLNPKGKKKDGLFKRRASWLDAAATGMPLREKGQLVKNPSHWLEESGVCQRLRPSGRHRDSGRTSRCTIDTITGRQSGAQHQLQQVFARPGRKHR